jgi:hypothetical protein
MKEEFVVVSFVAMLVGAGALSSGCKSQAERDADKALRDAREAPNGAAAAPTEATRDEPKSASDRLPTRSLPEYRGKTLHPACVTALVSWEKDAGRVALDSCGGDGGSLTTEGASVTFTPEDVGLSGRAEDRYSVLGEVEGGWALSYVWNGGGSGYFSGVVVARVEKDALVLVHLYAAGDRCNGGLESAELANGALVLKSRMTPFDVAAGEEAETAALKAYDALDSSALSCVALAVERAAGGKRALSGVELSEDVEAVAGETGMQACYNELHQSSVKQGKRVLDAAALQAFTAAFRAKCVK